MGPVLIVGCGDVGRRIARRVRELGVPVCVLLRSEASAARLRALGVEARIADLDAPPFSDLPTAGATVHYLAPPPSVGMGDPRLARFLEQAAAAPPRRIVYVSTSGVYGNCGGALVDESRAPHPESDRARRRLDAEKQLLPWSVRHGVSAVILRVAGIYGPGRLPVARLRAGTPVVCPEQAPYSNRIHAEDLARVCIAAAERGVAGGIYNVADGETGSMTDYFYAVADRLGLARPPCIPLAEAEKVLGPRMWSFLRESRRLDVSRMRRELGIELLYPGLESGLAASLAEEARADRARA